MIRRRKNARPEASLDEIFRDTAERPRYEIIAVAPTPKSSAQPAKSPRSSMNKCVNFRQDFEQRFDSVI
jgi:hypothetical protein